MELLREARLLAWLGRALAADDRELVQRALRLLCAGGLHEDRCGAGPRRGEGAWKGSE